LDQRSVLAETSLALIADGTEVPVLARRAVFRRHSALPALGIADIVGAGITIVCANHWNSGVTDTLLAGLTTIAWISVSAGRPLLYQEPALPSLRIADVIGAGVLVVLAEHRRPVLTDAAQTALGTVAEVRVEAGRSVVHEQVALARVRVAQRLQARVLDPGAVHRCPGAGTLVADVVRGAGILVVT